MYEVGHISAILVATCLAFVLGVVFWGHLRRPLYGIRPHKPGPPLPPTSQPNHRRVARVERSLRFTDLPPSIDESELRAGIAPAGEEHIVGLSLVSSTTKTEARRSKVASVCFTRVPDRIANQIPRLQAKAQIESRLIHLKFGTGSYQFHVDDAFYGLTPLFCPERWEVDIVAVTGWNGKAFMSWKPEEAVQMWLRDWLGQDLAAKDCQARIFTYGYPSKLAGGLLDATLYDYGNDLLDSLLVVRQSETPLVFIAHSLGGLVVKQALRDAHFDSSGEKKALAHSCAGLFMFGVPNLGLENKALLEMTRGQPNDAFARSLGISSPYLLDLEHTFSVAFRDRGIPMIGIAEASDSPSVQRAENGSWTRTGPMVRMVSRDSAWSPGTCTERWTSLTNHSNLVKFGKRDDPTYQKLVRTMARIVSSVRADGRISDGGKDQAETPSSRKSQASKQIDIPTHLVTKFVGRDIILSSIDKFFSTTQQVPVFVLHGMGGMGKTQIALQYTLKHMRDYVVTAWIQANSETSIHQSFLAIASSLGMSDMGEFTADLVLVHLAQAEGRVLLVYDNLDDPRLVSVIGKHHKPRWGSSLRVLITTRERIFLDFAVGGESRSVEPLPLVEACTLLQSLIDDGSEQAEDRGPVKEKTAAEICTALGCLPLGIQQAAAYIRTGAFPLQVYVEHLKKDTRQAFEYTSSWWPYGKTILNVWEESLAQVVASPAHPYPFDWFHTCSFLDSTVPQWVFERAHEFYERQCRDVSQLVWLDRVPLVTDIAELTRLSLVKAGETKVRTGGHETTYSYHPLVQQWARMRLPEDLQRKFLVLAATLVWAAAEGVRFQHEPPPRRDTRAAFRRQQGLLPHVYSLIEFSAKSLGQNISALLPLEIIVVFANFSIHEQRLEEAEKVIKEGLLRMSETASTIDILEARRTLSLALRRQATDESLVEALSIQEAVVEELEKLVRDQEYPRIEMVIARGELAAIHRDRGYVTRAIQLQADVVDEMAATCGARSTEVLQEMNCLSVLYAKAEMQEKALALQEQVVKVFREHWPDAEEVWNTIRNLAISYFRAGRYKDAIGLEMQILDKKTADFGPEHLEAASAQDNLARSLLRGGRADEAHPLFSEALKTQTKFLGSSHAKTRKTARYEARCRKLLVGASSEAPPDSSALPKNPLGTGILHS
ncbi:hypothetical protein F4678DRAFT_243760 [Xylaria arbuscula]|nr:hypothetical protein F4678DRAFT_243760 [Xylaria arbuscula]